MYSMRCDNSIITLTNTDDLPTGKRFKARFITAGLAGYPDQFGTVLIKKESLDKFVDTLVGRPVVIRHQEVTNDNIKKVDVGRVANVWFDEKDGWYWCDGVITDDKALNLINSGWSVSCSYNVTLLDDKGGMENNIPYDMEFLDGVFTHLALVDNPRYEKALVVLNSKTEFVTVGEGESKHPIPLEYITKEKEEDKKTDKPENKTEDKKRTKLDVEKDLKDLRQKILQFRSKGDLTEYQKMKKKYEELLEEYRPFTSVKKPEEKEATKRENKIETTDQYGRLVINKPNSKNKVKISKDGDQYFASHGQQIKDFDGYEEFQVYPGTSGKTFKTLSGAKKWAYKVLEIEQPQQLKLLNSLIAEALTEAITENCLK